MWTIYTDTIILHDRYFNPDRAVPSGFTTSYSGVIGDYVPMGCLAIEKDFSPSVRKENSLLMTTETQLPPVP